MARAYFADHLGEMEVSGSFGSGPLSVIPFCHRISITHGATSTAPSTREVAYERQKIDNAATVSRGTLRPVIYLGRKYEASVTSYTPPVGCRSASCNKQHLYRVVTLTGLRALRDLRAPRWPGMILGFLRHASEVQRQPSLRHGCYPESR